MGHHLLFYDGNCGLCDQIVQLVLASDTQERFDFAPLQGTTAEKMLAQLPQEMKSADSLVLIEDYQSPDKKFAIYGKGALRTCWILGGFWAIPGALSFLPSFLYDWAYRLVAKNRHKLFRNDRCVIPIPEKRNRFLP